MKTRIMALTALVVVLSLPLGLYAQETDPAAVVRAMVDVFNTGDMDALMAFWADDSVMEVVHLDATYTGADEIRAVFEMLIVEQNFEMHIEEVLQVEGDRVTTRTSMSSDPLREMGVTVISTQVYAVQGGKIKSLRCSWSEESLAAIQAATATLPETGGELGGSLFPTHTLAAALGGLVLLGGVGLGLLRHRSHQRR